MAISGPTYLGDSVYGEFDGYSIRLWLDNGYGPKHEIVIEFEVLQNLVEFVAAHNQFSETPIVRLARRALSQSNREEAS